MSYIAVRLSVKIKINVRFRLIADCKCCDIGVGTYCNLTHLSECQCAAHGFREFGDRVTETRTNIQTVTRINNTQFQVGILHLLTSKTK